MTHPEGHKRTKNPEQHLKELQALFTSVEVSVHEERDCANMASMGELQGKKTLLTQKTKQKNPQRLISHI